MNFEITEGVVNGAQKVVFYGPEGIGKTKFASKFPDPVFIDTEGSTKKYNVRRLPKPTSWQILIDEVKSVINNRPCKTLVIDTADWAERLCTEAVCSRHGKSGVEEFGYGTGYTYVAEEWGRFLNLLQDVVDVANINVVLTAHAIIRKFEQPNEMGAYDRYELKLGKKTTAQTAPITKEWADMVLFANYKTFSVAVDDKGKKHKAQGGQRVMYTTHHPCWDAKNRDGLPEELPLDYSTIAHLFSNQLNVSSEIPTNQFKSTPILEKQQLANDHEKMEIPEELKQMPFNDGAIQEAVPTPNVSVVQQNVESIIPKELKDLMDHDLVLEEEIRKAVSMKGYYPEDTPIDNYDPNFINGVLIGAWPQILEFIKTNVRAF